MAKQSDITGNKEALAKRVTPQTRRSLQAQIKENKLLREEEKNRKAAAAAAAEEAKMEVDSLDDNEEEVAYFREEARLAAEAQARLDAERQEQGGVHFVRPPTGNDEVEEVVGSGENGGSGSGDNGDVDMDTDVGGTGLSEEDNVEAEEGTRGEKGGEPFDGDKFDGDINRHLAELNMKGGTSDASPAPIDLDTKSPAKKKSRSRAPSTPGLPRSILKTTPHDHVNKRVILEANVVLNGANPFLQFAEKIRSIISNARIVDEHFQIDPICATSSNKPLTRTQDVSNNLTLLTEYIKIQGNMNVFQRKKSFGGVRKKKGDQDRDPMVWFCFAASYDPTTQYLLHRIGFEWNNQGGGRLQVKSIYSFDSVTPVMCFKLWIDTDADTLVQEFRAILQETWDVEKSKLVSQFGNTLVLPEIGVRINSPWIPGVKPAADFKSSNARKLVHFEMDSGSVLLVKHLVERAKDLGIMAAKWGLKAHITETGLPLTAKNIERLIEALRSHESFTNKMLEGAIAGVDFLDKKEPFYDVDDSEKVIGTLSLRDLFLKYVKLENGTPAIAEVHQAVPMSGVSVVFPNSAEAETVLEKINKNTAAYLIFALQDEGLPEEFLRRITKSSCSPSNYEKAMSCTWDEVNKSVLFEGEQPGAAKKKSWYAKERGVHMVDKVKQKVNKKPHTRAEDQYDLDTVGSVKTIHECNAARAERAARVAKDLTDDEDEEMEEEEMEKIKARKSKTKKKAEKKKKSSGKGVAEEAESTDDEDSEDDVVEIKARKKAKKKKGKTKKGNSTKKSGDSSEEDSLERTSTKTPLKYSKTDSASNHQHSKSRSSIDFCNEVTILGDGSSSSSSSGGSKSDSSDSSDSDSSDGESGSSSNSSVESKSEDDGADSG